MDDGTSAIDWITLVVAIAGFGLALLSLGWQGATFFLSGSRVKVEFLRGALGSGGLATAPPVAWDTMNRNLMASQGVNVEVLAVRARNTGRMPVAVESVALVFDNGIQWSESNSPGNVPLPHRLEPGESQTWFVHADPGRAILQTCGLSVSGVRFTVGLGTGKFVRTGRVMFR